MDPLGCVRWQDLLHPSQWTWPLRCIATFVVSFLRTTYNVRDQDLSSKAKRLLHMCDSQNMDNSDFYTHCEDSNCGIDDYKPYINHTPCSSTMAHIYTHPDKKNAWDKSLEGDRYCYIVALHAPKSSTKFSFFFQVLTLRFFHCWSNKKQVLSYKTTKCLWRLTNEQGWNSDVVKIKFNIRF